MKKIVLIVLFGVMCSYSHAQIAWGVRAGMCYSIAMGEGGNMFGKPSIEAGPTAYHSLNANVYLNYGLMFSMKNFEQNDASLTGYFVDLPVGIGYAFHIGKLALYAQVGPYAGVKVAEEFKYGKQKVEREDDLLTNFNYGLGGAAGINIYKFKIELGTQYGLANINSGENKITIASVFAGISYVF
jgi:hypothetical protein